MKRKVQSVELWRVFFSFSIVLCHAVFLIPWKGNGYLRSSTYAVEFFFILSGYLMAVSACSRKNNCVCVGEETWMFLWSKIRSILPMYLFASIMNFLIMFLLYDPDVFSHPYLYDYIWDYTFLRVTGLGGTHDSAVSGGWYLSAMLVSMMILYPLLRKFPDVFLHIIAPLATVFIMGWNMNQYGAMGQALSFHNGVCLGLLRGISCICLGCVCYLVVQKLDTIFPTKPTLFFTILELAAFLIVLYINFTHKRSRIDFFCIFLLGVGMVAVFSKRSYTFLMNLPPKFVSWMSKFSLAIYLNHYVWGKVLAEWKLPVSFWIQLSWIVALSIISAVVCIFTTDFALNLIKQHRGKTGLT